MSEDYDWSDYDSGPFCRHWGEYGSCDDKCKCGHTCSQHPEDECGEDGCDCKKYVDDDSTPDYAKAKF